MKFRALLPLGLMLLLAPSCGCRKTVSTCYRKSCPTNICPTTTYGDQTTSQAQGYQEQPELVSNELTPMEEAQEVEFPSEELDQDEFTTTEEEQPAPQPQAREAEEAPMTSSIDKESLDDELYDNELLGVE